MQARCRHVSKVSLEGQCNVGGHKCNHQSSPVNSFTLIQSSSKTQEQHLRLLPFICVAHVVSACLPASWTGLPPVIQHLMQSPIASRLGLVGGSAYALTAASLMAAHNWMTIIDECTHCRHIDTAVAPCMFA